MARQDHPDAACDALSGLSAEELPRVIAMLGAAFQDWETLMSRGFRYESCEVPELHVTRSCQAHCCRIRFHWGPESGLMCLKGGGGSNENSVLEEKQKCKKRQEDCPPDQAAAGARIQPFQWQS